MSNAIQPSRIVGILGGMGPEATVDFYAKLVHATTATRDQDHLRVVIWADPTVPSRQEAILADGEDLRPWLEAGIQHLLSCGAEILAVPCNTVHAFLPEVVAGKNVEFISIIEVVIEAIVALQPTGAVGILATDAALASGIFQSALKAAGIQSMVPSASSQAKVTQVVHSVKVGADKTHAHHELSLLLNEFQDRSVSTVIAGCTELSVLLANMEVAVRIIDPSEVLARKVVDRARNG